LLHSTGKPFCSLDRLFQAVCGFFTEAGWYPQVFGDGLFERELLLLQFAFEDVDIIKNGLRLAGASADEGSVTLMPLCRVMLLSLYHCSSLSMISSMVFSDASTGGA